MSIKIRAKIFPIPHDLLAGTVLLALEDLPLCQNAPLGVTWPVSGLKTGFLRFSNIFPQ